MIMNMIEITVIFNYCSQIGLLYANLQNPFVGITARMPGSVDDISFHDWYDIKKNYGDQICYYKQYYSSDGFYIIFASDDFYENILGLNDSVQNDVVLMGDNVRNYLAELQLHDENLVKHYDVASSSFFGVQISNFISFDEVDYTTLGLLSAINYTADSIVIPSFDDFLIFPISAYAEIPCQSIIALPIKDIETEDDLSIISQKICNFLTSRHPEGDYVIKNYVSEAEQILSRNNELARYISFLAIFVIVVVVLGFSGLLLVFINQRKRDFATSLMCGATYFQIILEVFFEVLFTVLIGAVLGNLLCIPVLPFLGGIGVSTDYSVISLVLCGIGGIIMSLAVCFIILNKIRHISPVNTLREL